MVLSGMKNVRLHWRLLMGFSVVASIVLIVSFFASHALQAGELRFKGYIAGIQNRERLAAELRAAAAGRAIAARNLVLVTGVEAQRAEHASLQRDHLQVVSLLAKLNEAIQSHGGATEADKRLLGKINAIEAQYSPIALEIARLAANGDREAATAKLIAECRPLLEALVLATAEMQQEQDRASQLAVDQMEFANSKDQDRLIAATCFAVFIAMILALGIAKSITRPMEEAVIVAEAVAEGDLSASVSTDRGDELGRLLRAMRKMSGNLSEMVNGVRQAADGVRNSSHEIAHGNQNLSQRTEVQASALQETAASMQEMTTAVQHSAASARQANQLAADATDAARQGGDVVAQVVTTMQGISQSSARIADIIGTIDEIAFQTNILALNAAVEAARAGEQGRGFAVVASEVRNLANRSATAAKEVRTLIRTSLERVDAGASLVIDAGAAMERIVVQVDRVADLLGEVYSASEAQSSGLLHVNQAVASIEEKTQQNAALVEQSALASESLRLQADALAQTISRFRIAHVEIA